MRRLPSWATAVMSAVGLIAVWWITSVTVFANVGSGNTKAIPTPVQVIQDFGEIGFDFDPTFSHHDATLGALGHQQPVLGRWLRRGL